MLRTPWPARASNWRIDRRTGAAAARALAGLVAALWLALVGPPASAEEPPQQPFLRIEVGGHTAPVSRMATDAAGRLLATVSDDKTLRLWSLPGGAPRRVIRPPIGPLEEGELYAVALSPDGTRAFTGGYTARSWDGAYAIYIFDTETGRLLGRLPGLPAPVQHLATSPDGSRLAAALKGQGIRVFDEGTGRLLFEDKAYAGPARAVAFDAAGRLASTGADGRVRIYDVAGRKLADRAPVPGARPFGVAWSPDSTLLAVGFEDRLRVEVLTAADLRAVLSHDAVDLQGEGLPAVAWAPDKRGGVQLYAAGYARGPHGAFVVRRWADFGFGPAVDIRASRDTIAQLLPLPPSGAAGVVFAAHDPGWGRIGPDGRLAIAPRPAIANFRAVFRGTDDARGTDSRLGVSADGMRIRFALQANAPPLVFDAGAGRLLEQDPGGVTFSGPRTQTPRLPPAEDWNGTNRPRLGRAPLRLGDGEFSRSLAILPGDDALLLGTDSHLRMFDASGRQLDAVPVPGTVWEVAVAGDVAVAALGDGTLRWFDLRGGRLQERAALFVHAGSRRWVLWTPDGLFDHSPMGGQDLVGVHLNGGRLQSTEWSSFAQAYRALYAPAAVKAQVAGDNRQAAEHIRGLGDLRSRIRRMPVLQGGRACALTSSGCEALAWDAAVLPDGATALRLSFAAQDRGLGVGRLDVMVNDRIAASAEPGPAEREVEVPLDPGPNRITTRLYTDDRTVFAEGPAMELGRPGDPGRPGDTGRFVMLAVGVNRHANPELNLRFAVPDARSVAEALRAAATRLFREVSVTLLKDEEATRQGVLAALDKAAASVRPDDTFVLYLAGHGDIDKRYGRFLFVTSDVRDTSSWEKLRRQALNEDTLIEALTRIRARDAFLFVDTCHAGYLTVDNLAAVGNETGRFMLAASTSVQEALDSYNDRNGIFAFAVLDGLSGRAADRDGRVSALALGDFVTRRVPELAKEKRFGQNAVFRAAQNELRSFPLGMVAR